MTEAFPFLEVLNSIPGICAGWTDRENGLSITGDRDEAMRMLRTSHQEQMDRFAGSGKKWWRAEQVHGISVAVIPCGGESIANDGLSVIAGVDGLLTNRSKTPLAIYVADCGVIWLADPEVGAIGLLHSGKKGTAGNILENAIFTMERELGARRDRIVAVLGPCIRVPDYDSDFATNIGNQARNLGVKQYVDCGLNTAADTGRFYSYRKEYGKTGRMMAMMMRD